MEFTSKKKLSIGQKIERIRTYRGFKQEYLAAKLGVSQQQVSKIEQQEEIEESLLKQIAEVLGVSPEVIENFDDEKITQVINNQYNFYNTEVKDNATHNFIFNPLEKIAELYERLLTSEREKNELLKNQS
ncbi:helix-turn-helix domain-containing protein [Mucilaginibacter lacusdianchii]|uniref:helix-turn-helix domain-containing protein n=1 Tax=Mucilaginibacter lacusdianchii TaxID=2684211 RepID=UPI00131B40F3|nr:helix-turn-helix transcriptional regulator [Mucilaginibacter sp. JXJ CY 39]